MLTSRPGSMWKQRADSSREKSRTMGSGLAEMISRGARRCAHLLLQEKFPADAVALTIEIRDVGLQSGSWGDGGRPQSSSPATPFLLCPQQQLGARRRQKAETNNVCHKEIRTLHN